MQEERRTLMKARFMPRWRWRSWAVATVAFVAVLGGTTLTTGMLAADAAVGAHQANVITRSRIVNKTCQTRAGGVKTCEWLFEWVHENLGNPNDLTTGFEAFASMNSTHNKQIKQVRTYATRCRVFTVCPPHEVAVLTGPGGTGYIQGHDGARLCAGSDAGGLEAVFTYKYWMPKPVSAWISGTARGKWQIQPRPCHLP